MKVEFHFVEDETLRFPRPLIAVLLATRKTIRDDHSTKVFTGTVLFDAPVTTMETTETGHVGRVDKTLLARVIQFWLEPPRTVFSTLGKTARRTTTTSEVFAVALETVPPLVATRIDEELTDVEGYVGAREIDDANPIDLGIYTPPGLCATAEEFRLSILRWHGGFQDALDTVRARRCRTWPGGVRVVRREVYDLRCAAHA